MFWTLSLFLQPQQYNYLACCPQHPEVTPLHWRDVKIQQLTNCAALRLTASTQNEGRNFFFIGRVCIYQSWIRRKLLKFTWEGKYGLNRLGRIYLSRRQQTTYSLSGHSETPSSTQPHRHRHDDKMFLIVHAKSRVFQRMWSYVDNKSRDRNIDPVSYTHLTLPTIDDV